MQGLSGQSQEVAKRVSHCLRYNAVRQDLSIASQPTRESSVLQNELNQNLIDIAKGDQQALVLLFQTVSARLFGVQLRILKNRELAEEALQETFLKVWNSADTYNEQHSAPMTWLNTLARNQALDMLRRSKTRSEVNVKIPDLNPDNWDSPVREFSETQEAFEELSHCLEVLNPDARAAIVGVYCEGYTQEEMSRTLDSPVGTVKSWIRRGLLSLRECLEK